jgi:tetratricopeptide (TPR) repeat protein/DNA-binding XRE family transcriptional regulator
MNASKAWEKLRAAEASPEFLEIRAKEFPYREVALAVIDLRGRLGLTQGQLAEQVGTTQSVISRLESGKQPVEIKLLARIGESVGEPLVVAFGEFSAGTSSPTGDIGQQGIGQLQVPQPQEVAVSGDPLLDQFNRANTAGDWQTSHVLAAAIAKDPSTPRRRLALALDAYNRRLYGDAERWATEALRGSLPPTSSDTAALIRGRALINLKRARAALRALSAISQDSHLGWFVPAARADAYVELHDPAKAMAESNRAVAMAPEIPVARYHAARTLWHADRVWEALDQISIYRAADPTNTEGILLHGSILGFLGSTQHDDGAFESALTLFEQALRTDDCEAIRLYAITAARLGRWKPAFAAATKLLRHRGKDGSGECQHTENGLDHSHFVHEHIVPDAFQAIAERAPAETEQAVEEAQRRFGASPYLTSQKALASAVKGDLAKTLELLGRTRETVAEAPTDEQIAVAAALYVRLDFAGAYQILKRIKDDLSRPIGLIRLAECAASAGELDDARKVLEELAEPNDFGGQIASVAMTILQAQLRTSRQIAPVAESEMQWHRLVAGEADRAPRESLWEGQHHPTTPMVDTLASKAYLN